MPKTNAKAVLEAGFFDGLAPSYDAQFSHRLGGRWLRELVRERADAFIHDGARVLEIGCGTGEDAVYFAERGCLVTATDASDTMLASTRAKVARSTHPERVTCMLWDANRPIPAALAAMPPFDVVFSNFGAINCLALDRALAARIAASLKPNGTLIVVAMAPLCPWEILWFGVRGQRQVALRRIRSSATFATDGGIAVSYPSVANLARLLGPTFRLRRCFGVGVLLPPSFAFHCVERWPRFFGSMKRLERRLAEHWPFTRLNDHYMAVFDARDGAEGDHSAGHVVSTAAGGTPG